MKKIIITVIGKDAVGILAKTCTYLAKEHINILDIRCQKSEIFEKMHRV